MTAMNVVHMRVQPGHEDRFLDLHRELLGARVRGLLNFWVTRTGDRSFVIVGEWEHLDDLVAARPWMVANLDRLRPILEDLGGGRGVTEPWSGEVALSLQG